MLQSALDWAASLDGFRQSLLILLLTTGLTATGWLIRDARRTFVARRSCGPLWIAAEQRFDEIWEQEGYPRVCAYENAGQWELGGARDAVLLREVAIQCRGAGNLLREVERWRGRWRRVDPVQRWLQYVADQGEVTDSFEVEGLDGTGQRTLTNDRQIESVTESSSRVCRLCAANARPLLPPA